MPNRSRLAGVATGASAARRRLALPLALLLAAGSGDISADGTLVAELPLKRGYYVASDTPCAQASNATLLRLRRNGIGGARDFCEFRRIERTGASSYRVTEACADLQGSDEEIGIVSYEIAGNASFTARSERGWQHSARFCAQSSLPPAWRDDAIGDLID